MDNSVNKELEVEMTVKLATGVLSGESRGLVCCLRLL